MRYLSTSVVAALLYKATSLRKTLEHKFLGATVKDRLEKLAQHSASEYEGKGESHGL